MSVTPPTSPPRIMRPCTSRSRSSATIAVPSSSEACCSRSRDPDELELTLGERLRGDGPAPALPVRPEGSKLALREGAESVIEFPGQRLSLAAVLVFLGAPTFFLVLFWLGSTARTLPVMLAVPAFLLVMVVRMFASAARPKFVAVSRGGIAVRSFGARTRRIAFSELEELVRTPDGIHLLSDEAHVVIPQGWMASKEEASFIADVIEHAAYRHTPGAPAAPTPWATPVRPGDSVPGGASPPLEPERARRWRARPDRTFLYVGALLLTVGLAGSALGAHLVAARRAFLAHAQVTEGTVVELVRSRGRRNTVYRPVVRFVLPSGQPLQVTSSSGSNPAPYAVGERVEVRYDPASPGDAEVGSLRNVWALPFFVCGLAGALALGGVALLRWYREEAREAAAAPPASARGAQRRAVGPR